MYHRLCIYKALRITCSKMKVRHILHDSKNISYKCLYIHELQNEVLTKSSPFPSNTIRIQEFLKHFP